MSKSGTRRRGSRTAFEEALKRQAENAAADRQREIEAERAEIKRLDATLATREGAITQYNFHLVQRLESRDPADKKYLLPWFRCDYMGSPEFEWGAIPEAYRFMQARGPVTVIPFEFAISGVARTVYAVTHPEHFGAQLTAFDWWSRPHQRFGHAIRGFHGKEWTNFPDVFAGERRFGGSPHTTDAWWAIEAGFAWTLDPELAKKLASGFNEPLA